MKKLLALLFIFVSLSSLKTEILLSTENPSMPEELKREPVPVPTQKQVQDVPVHSKPAWGKTIEAMFDQHPKKFILGVFVTLILPPVSCLPGGLILRHVYHNTEVPIQGTPNVELSGDKK